MKWLEVAPLLVAASRLLTGHRAKSLAVLLIFDNVLSVTIPQPGLLTIDLSARSDRALFARARLDALTSTG